MSRPTGVIDPETPDPETPDPETPDPETPDPETPDPETPDPETDKDTDKKVVLQSLINGAMSFDSSSPLDRLNQHLAKSWSFSGAPQAQADELASSAQVLVTTTQAVLGDSRSYTTSAVVATLTTTQLLELALDATMQGNNPTARDIESLNSWVVRSSHSARASELSTQPKSLSREEPVSADTPDASSAAEVPVAPIDATPIEPVESPATEPSSNVRWLLPQGDLSRWSDEQISDATQPGLSSVLPSNWPMAMAKFGQWMGWPIDRSTQAPGNSDSVKHILNVLGRLKEPTLERLQIETPLNLNTPAQANLERYDALRNEQEVGS